MQSIDQALPKFIFWSRWFQAPLYIGLVLVLILYVYQFAVSLIHLILNVNTIHESELMLRALDLIDVVLIANLIIMVVIGGYETFVSKLNVRTHPDHPEWLDEVNAGSMKIKLSLALVSISSIHLLRTFIDPSQQQNFAVMWQVIIHLTLVVSGLAVALTNRLISK